MVTANGHENVCFISVWRDIMKNRRAAAVAFLTAVLIILQFFPAQAAEVQELMRCQQYLWMGRQGVFCMEKKLTRQGRMQAPQRL